MALNFMMKKQGHNNLNSLQKTVHLFINQVIVNSDVKILYKDRMTSLILSLQIERHLDGQTGQTDGQTDRCALNQEVRSSKNEKLMTFPPHPQLVICLQVGGGEREESRWLRVSCVGRPMFAGQAGIISCFGFSSVKSKYYYIKL